MSRIEIAKNLSLEDVTIKNAYFEDVDGDGLVDETEKLAIEFEKTRAVIKGSDVMNALKGQTGSRPLQVKDLSHYLKNILQALKEENRCSMVYTSGSVWEVFATDGVYKEWWWDSHDARTHIDILTEAGRCTFHPAGNTENSPKICALMYTAGAVWKIFLNGDYVDWYSDYFDAEERAQILKNAGRCDEITSR